jgi:hypothetical protein
MQKADRSVVFNYSIDVQSVQCMQGVRGMAGGQSFGLRAGDLKLTSTRQE